MTGISEILAKYGITLPQDKQADFNKDFAANYKSVAEVTKIEAARDNYKSQLDTAQTSLRGFEGVDVNELKKQIGDLQTQLTNAEKNYQAKLDDMDFQSLLDSAISGSGAKNGKAVKALLDIDALKASKNRTADIESALSAIKADNDYLFKSDEPIKNPVAATNTNRASGDPMAAIRAAMGLKPKE